MAEKVGGDFTDGAFALNDDPTSGGGIVPGFQSECVGGDGDGA
jgi:hypothetical protein